MQIIRLCRTVAVLTLFSFGACAESPVVETATERPTILQGLAHVAGISDNDIVHGDALAEVVRKTIQARDFASLNAMADHFRTSRSRLPGGTWELDSFYGAVQRALAPKPGEGCVLKGTDFTAAWAAFDAEHASPYIAEAGLLVSHGWCLRGGDYASSTAREAMGSFAQYVGEAHQVLSAHEDIVRQDPEYYALMEKIYMAQGRGDWAFSSLFDEGSSRFPYYYGIYFNAAWRAMPQWGGSVEDVEEVARHAAERTREEDGDGAYARVFWARMECNCDLAEFPIDRALLRRAMDDVMQRTPSDWNAAHFAQMACKLGDRDLTASFFTRGWRDHAGGWNDPEKQWCRDFAA